MKNFNDYRLFCTCMTTMTTFTYVGVTTIRGLPTIKNLNDYRLSMCVWEA